MDQLEDARKEQKAHGGKLTSALVRSGAIDEKVLTQFLGQQYGFPTIDLSNFEISPEVISMLGRRVCEKHCVIPVSRSGRNLVVAFSDPSNIFIKDDLSLLTRCKIEIVVAPDAAINRAIEKYYGGGGTKLDSVMSALEDSDDQYDQLSESNATLVDGGATDEAPIIKFVNAMLVEAIKTKTSDIHIEPYEKRFRIRFRIDGKLVEKTQPPPGAANAISSRIKILCKLDIAEKRRPQDGRLKVRLKNGSDVDFRVSILPTLFGEKIVLRLLDKSNLQVDMTKLGLENDDYETLKEIVHRPQGMVLITGPTGSGKTTTVYSSIAELNAPDANVSTAEDPVEFNLDGVNQVQINADIGFGFPEALRSFLRQDPDVVVVGEIRDLETAQIAYKAASTGHMVISTLHTNDASSTVTRLVDMGIAPYMVAEATSLVIAQRLIRKLCERCAVEQKINAETLIKLGVEESKVPEYTRTRVAEGCSACNHTGLSGRLAIFEVLRFTRDVKEGIFEGASPLELKRRAIKSGGLRSLRQAALLKLKEGLTSVEEVINSSVEDLL
ncbi:MAG: type IV-A pilus assembly ATPase PilB [Bdellovibrionales bacterium]|nr:type IV-A pilus assembly ATPase PilB [Bdellovibrionales bacterium]